MIKEFEDLITITKKEYNTLNEEKDRALTNLAEQIEIKQQILQKHQRDIERLERIVRAAREQPKPTLRLQEALKRRYDE